MQDKVFRIGCDIGGTFTDFVAVNRETGETSVEKVLTTPARPADAILTGFDKIAETQKDFMSRSELIVHGTTLVINALIERKGNKTALITTRGFKDVLETRNELRYDVYDLQIELPKPLVPRALRFEVTQRTTKEGQNAIDLEEGELAGIVEEIRAQGVETVAVCFLHSYANNEHEKRVGAYLKKHAPEIEISLSCEVLPEINEYKRVSTTSVNAYVKPKVQQYLQEISQEAANRSFDGDFFIMQSSSGIASEANARQFPARIVESGPAAGVALAQWWGEKSGLKNVLAFDMGGTTAKLCAIDNGEALVTNEYETARVYHFKTGSGISINVPVVDLLEIGAGGGSIAHIDTLGLLKVGPESAGASPGPVCYGLGGSRPAVTDADLALGYLSAEYFLGSSMKLVIDDTMEAIRRDVATPLGVDVIEGAYGIHNLVNENMAAAARLHLAERSVDTTSISMIAYGGAGPVHAFGVARKLGCKFLLVPRYAGLVSALGMLVANVSMDTSRSLKVTLANTSGEELENELQALQHAAQSSLPNVGEGGVLRFHRRARMKYVGQGHSLEIVMPDVLSTPSALEDVWQRYQDEYKRLYGRNDADVEVEIETLKVIAEIVPEHDFTLPLLPVDGTPVEAAVKGTRMIYVPGRKEMVECKIYDRYKLRVGHEFTGPAIIEERETSTVVNDEADILVDEMGALVITVGKE